MATLKQIRQRIKTSKNIQQITRAMKLMSAARLTRAKMKVEEARPYSDQMRVLMGRLGAAGDLPDDPLLARRKVEKTVLVLITADRGLAGPYNSALIRKAQDFLKAVEGDVELLCVGKKGHQFFGRRGYAVQELYQVPTAGARLMDAVEITRRVRDQFISGSADAIFVCYSKFWSPIRQTPEIVQVLPIEPPHSEEEAEGAHNEREYRFEPAPKELLGLLLDKYLLTVVYQAMLEASASEHGARMNAMSNATDSAREMIQNLTLTANQARQAAITKEILEIVGGAEALKG